MIAPEKVLSPRAQGVESCAYRPGTNMVTSSSPAPMPAPIVPLEMRKGTELQSRYVVSELIGTGGFASVWRATDKELNRDVAIKRLIRDNWRSASAADVAAVLEEGRNAARLKGHRNIVEVFGVSKRPGRHFW
jgi:hypothetical protein